MEEFEIQDYVKIDTKAPVFDLPYYDPKTDNDGSISSEELK
jgi:hypothetical protein